MAPGRGWAPWRKSPTPAPTEPQPALQPQPSLLPVALRAPTVPHHWLTVLVARSGPSGPIPIANARVAVRPFPREAARPGDVLARGTTGLEGTVALFLPAGRYAVSATDDHDQRAATLTLEHAGRAVLVLEGTAPRVILTVEARTADDQPAPGAVVDVRVVPAGMAAARGVTDARGVAAIPLSPGAYEVQVGEATIKTYLEADTVVRLRAPAAAPPPPAAPLGRYAQRARAATGAIAPLDTEWVREETWN